VPEALQVFCTIDSEIRARDLAEALVDAGAAACVQVVGPIHSTFRWRGATEHQSEWLLLAKTTSQAFPSLRGEIERRHPYEVPEIVAVPIVDGLAGYLAWIGESVTPGL
jgi:periplasmic divalent cation tolerance protein